jgi:GT2 family glycosyltransferase
MNAISSGSSKLRLSQGTARIDIIIVNWNSGSQLAECLSTVQSYGANMVSCVIVVDNASTDGSANGIENLFDLPVKIVHNGENVGFARACNQGARLGEAPYLLFLNPDTKLFPGSISKPLEVMGQEKNRDVGICGIQLVGDFGEVVRTCSRFPSLGRLTAQALGFNKFPGLKKTGMRMEEWDHESSRRVDQTIGAFFLVWRELFESLGGFDEVFFVYFEEVDFSFRAKIAGYKSMYLADVQAYHAGGGTSRQVKEVRLFYSLRSRLIYGLKHFPAPQAWALLVVTMIFEPISRFFFCVAKRNWVGISNTIQGYRRLWGALPCIIASRRLETK